MGSYSPSGCAWMSFTGAAGVTTARWPSDNAGGYTATSTASTTASATSCTVYGILLKVSANANIIISNHAGTALVGHTIPIVAGSTVPQYIPLGGPEGLVFPTGISASVSVDTVQCSIYFSRTD